MMQTNRMSLGRFGSFVWAPPYIGDARNPRKKWWILNILEVSEIWGTFAVPKSIRVLSRSHYTQQKKNCNGNETHIFLSVLVLYEMSGAHSTNQKPTVVQKVLQRAQQADNRITYLLLTTSYLLPTTRPLLPSTYCLRPTTFKIIMINQLIHRI